MGKKGDETPQFIIKSGSRYYLTTEVLEYDAAKAQGNATQKKGVEDVTNAFGSGGVNAKEIPAGSLASAAQTNPKL